MALKRKLSFLLGISVLGTIMVLGILQLFELRFRSGDIFPEYSSYRADPKGSKILYESLVDYPGIETSRQIKPLDELSADGQTVLLLGCSYYSMIRQYDDVLDPYLKAGGHVVLAFRPEDPVFKRRDTDSSDTDAAATHEVCTAESDGSEDPVVDSEDMADDSEPEEEVAEKGQHDAATCGACTRREREKRWQVKPERFTRAEMKEEDPEESAYSVSDEKLAALPWQSALFFDELGSEWTVLYEFLGKPVVIERAWGKGSVILMADSYLFSNEAMVIDRYTSEIVRILGTPRQILFDELHLGVQSEEGVMMLIHRYRLTGVLYAVLLLIGLFVWQRASSFIPKYTNPNDDRSGIGISVDSGQGFTNLLSRHIPRKELLKTMVAEWNSTFRHQVIMKTKAEKLDRESRPINQADNKEHPVDTYNRLLKNLNERN